MFFVLFPNTFVEAYTCAGHVQVEAGLLGLATSFSIRQSWLESLSALEDWSRRHLEAELRRAGLRFIFHKSQSSGGGGGRRLALEQHQHRGSRRRFPCQSWSGRHAHRHQGYGS